ncbi:MAG: hypothetical protein OZ921_11450 [Sorangiineae bacterium]|nr:hypothetical protein [Polyangiaceae bacterium]MEB2323121.1 hypothetical protein [Sorangiineae bacterium]
MIRSERRVDAPALAAFLSNVALVHTRFRLHAVQNARVINEDLLLGRAFRRAGKPSRPSMTVLLEGAARLTAYGKHHRLAPGDVLVVVARDAIQMRQEGDPYASFALEWEPGWLAEAPTRTARARLDARALRRARDAWSQLRAGDGDAEAIVEAVLAVGRQALVRVARPAAELREEASTRERGLTEALDHLLSNLADQPMMLDLSQRLEVTPRQLNRLIREYNRKYAFNAGGWLDTRNRRRLLVGATFMTVPGATAAYVASLIGYRSATAFARALRHARLPPPSEIALEVQRLGEATVTLVGGS